MRRNRKGIYWLDSNDDIHPFEWEDRDSAVAIAVFSEKRNFVLYPLDSNTYGVGNNEKDFPVSSRVPESALADDFKLASENAVLKEVLGRYWGSEAWQNFVDTEKINGRTLGLASAGYIQIIQDNRALLTSFVRIFWKNSRASMGVFYSATPAEGYKNRLWCLNYGAQNWDTRYTNSSICNKYLVADF